MKLSIPAKNSEEVMAKLKAANTAFSKIYPGDTPARQPVHTVYGGANLFKSDTVGKMGIVALTHFKSYAPDHKVLAGVLGWPESWKLASDVYNKIVKKLEREAIEDFRIDFEDGFGNRPDAEEDATAEFAANEVAKGMKENT